MGERTPRGTCQAFNSDDSAHGRHGLRGSSAVIGGRELWGAETKRETERLLVTTSKALVPSSVALVSTSFLFLLVRHLLLEAMHLLLQKTKQAASEELFWGSLRRM